jgi:hypothetical protein
MAVLLQRDEIRIVVAASNRWRDTQRSALGHDSAVIHR